MDIWCQKLTAPSSCLLKGIFYLWPQWCWQRIWQGMAAFQTHSLCQFLGCLYSGYLDSGSTAWRDVGTERIWGPSSCLFLELLPGSSQFLHLCWKQTLLLVWSAKRKLSSNSKVLCPMLADVFAPEWFVSVCFWSKLQWSCWKFQTPCLLCLDAWASFGNILRNFVFFCESQ